MNNYKKTVFSYTSNKWLYIFLFTIFIWLVFITFILVVLWVETKIENTIATNTLIDYNKVDYIKAIIGLAAFTTSISAISTYSVFNTVSDLNKNITTNLNKMVEIEHEIQTVREHIKIYDEPIDKLLLNNRIFDLISDYSPPYIKYGIISELAINEPDNRTKDILIYFVNQNVKNSKINSLQWFKDLVELNNKWK
jgi:hypothetical protein